MSTEKTYQSGADHPVVMRLDDVICFDENVSAELFANIIQAANRHTKSNAKISVPEMEALRRACAVIEAVVTAKISVVE